MKNRYLFLSLFSGVVIGWISSIEFNLYNDQVINTACGVGILAGISTMYGLTELFGRK